MLRGVMNSGDNIPLRALFFNSVSGLKTDKSYHYDKKEIE